MIIMHTRSHDKKKIVVDEYYKLKPSANTPDNTNIMNKIIEDFHNSDQIKKIPYLRYATKALKKYVIKKL
jgi:hypothetical protein